MRFGVVFTLLLAACGPSRATQDRRDFIKASRYYPSEPYRAIEAYRRYAATHRKAKEAALARERMAEMSAVVNKHDIDWIEAKRVDTTEAYENFLKTYAWTPRRSSARTALSTLAYRARAERKKQQEAKAAADKAQRAKAAEEATQRAFEAAKTQGDDALIRFMMNHGQHELTREARKLLKGWVSATPFATLTWKQLGKAAAGTAKSRGVEHWGIDTSKIQSRKQVRPYSRMERYLLVGPKLYFRRGTKVTFDHWSRVNDRLFYGVFIVSPEGLKPMLAIVYVPKK